MTEYSDRPGYSFNPGPPPEASRFLKNKGLKIAFSWQDVEPEEHAVAFTVAKAMQIDVLTTIREEVQKALDEGLPLAAFQKNLKPRLQALGWWGWKDMVDPETGDTVEARLGSPRRLRSIYNANLRSARVAGQWERIERTKKLLPFLEYRLGPSEHHRPHHAIKAGLVLPVDDPFWDAWMPPNGWGCKCWVKQITRREAEAKGVDVAPKLIPRKVLNKRTGEMKEVPPGIDPGWERNPGKLRLQNMEQLLAEKIEALPEAAAKVALRDIATSWRVERILDGAPGKAPVMMIPEAARVAAKETSRVVYVNADSKVHLVDDHPNENRRRFLQFVAELDMAAEAFLSWSKDSHQSLSLFYPGVTAKPNRPGSGLYVVIWFDDGMRIRTVFPGAARDYWERQIGRAGAKRIDLDGGRYPEGR